MSLPLSRYNFIREFRLQPDHREHAVPEHRITQGSFRRLSRAQADRHRFHTWRRSCCRFLPSGIDSKLEISQLTILGKKAGGIFNNVSLSQSDPASPDVQKALKAFDNSLPGVLADIGFPKDDGTTVIGPHMIVDRWITARQSSVLQ